MNSYTILDANRVSRQLPENLNEGDEVLFSKELSKDFPQVKINQVGNAFIVNGNMVVDHCLNPLCDYSHTSSQLTPLRERLHIGFKILKGEVKKLEGKFYWVVDGWSSNYFHWITDGLQKIYLLEKHFGPGLLLFPESLKQIPFIKHTLSYIDSSFRFFDDNILIKTPFLTTVTYPATPGNFNPLSFLTYRSWLLEKVKEGYSPNIPNIYISRKKAKTRRILNEDDVLDVLKPFDFQCLYLEDLSFEQQVNIFRKAKKIVSIHGAGLTNCIFSEQATVLEFRRKDDSFNNCYFSLCNILGHRYYYQLDSNVKGRKKDSDDFYIDLDHLKINLSKL